MKEITYEEALLTINKKIRCRKSDIIDCLNTRCDGDCPNYTTINEMDKALQKAAEALENIIGKK